MFLKKSNYYSLFYQKHLDPLMLLLCHVPHVMREIDTTKYINMFIYPPREKNCIYLLFTHIFKIVLNALLSSLSFILLKH